MCDWKKDRIGSAINGKNPMVMAELEAGYAVFGDTQFLPGYCVLLPKRNVSSLNNLKQEERTAFLNEMALLGDAILHICQPQRINYEILGNSDNFLHAHIFPRYQAEDPERLVKLVWLYDSHYWTDSVYQYDSQKHGQIRREIAEYLNKIVKGKYND